MSEDQKILVDKLNMAIQATGHDSDIVKNLIATLINLNKEHLKTIAATRPLLGAHTSIAGGYFRALQEGKEISADVVAMFVTSPKIWGLPELIPATLEKWNLTRALTGVEPGNVHGSYLINLATQNELLLEKSQQQIKLELERCSQLEAPLYTIHPGSKPVEEDIKKTLDRVAKTLTPILRTKAAQKTILCLETTAGSKSKTKIGDEFWHFGHIIRKLPKVLRNRIGITVDTCHIWAAGYDISTEKSYSDTIDLMAKQIGLKYIKAFHLNGCDSILGQNRDKHAPIGAPPMDLTPFKLLMNDSRFVGKIMTLETPNPEEWLNEIYMLKNLIGWTTNNLVVGSPPQRNEKNIYFGEINHGKRPYLVHNIPKPYIVWPRGIWI